MILGSSGRRVGIEAAMLAVANRDIMAPAPQMGPRDRIFQRFVLVNSTEKREKRGSTDANENLG